MSSQTRMALRRQIQPVSLDQVTGSCVTNAPAGESDLRPYQTRASDGGEHLMEEKCTGHGDRVTAQSNSASSGSAVVIR